MNFASQILLYTKGILTRIINQLTEHQLCELARDTAKKDLVDISLFLKGGFSIHSLFSITEAWLQISRMPYRYDINGKSRYILEVAFEAHTSCNITDNLVTIELQHGSIYPR